MTLIAVPEIQGQRREVCVALHDPAGALPGLLLTDVAAQRDSDLRSEDARQMKRGTAHSVSQVVETRWSSKLEIQDQSDVIGELTLPAFSCPSPTGSIWRSAMKRKHEQTTTEIERGLFDAEITVVPRGDKMKEGVMSPGERVRRTALMDREPRRTGSKMPVQLGKRGRRRLEHGTRVATMNGMQEAVHVAAVDEQDLRGIRQMQ